MKRGNNLLFTICLALVLFVTLGNARFDRYDSGIVVDNKTGLIWQDSYSGKEIKQGRWKDSLLYCENLTLGNKNDWRLPNIIELNSIVDYNKSKPAISSVFKSIIFFNDEYNYISSTLEASEKHEEFPLTVSFRDGSNSGEGYHDYFIRCVRGLPIPAPTSIETSTPIPVPVPIKSSKWNPAIYKGEKSYTINSTDTVKDNYTNLVWQKEDDNKFRNWKESKNYCDTLSLDEHSDWRLPTIEELFYLVDITKLNPAVSEYFNLRSTTYWSSTVYKDNYYDIKSSWIIGFGSGGSTGQPQEHNGLSLCVRNVK